MFVKTLEITNSVNERAPLGPEQTEENDLLKQKTLYQFDLPLLAGRTIMLPEYVKHLKDHHIIKWALKE